MYHDGNATSNMSNPPTPRGSTNPVTTATAFRADATHFDRSTIDAGITFSGANLLHKSPSTIGSTGRRPTPVRIVDQPVDKSESSAGQMPNQPVTLVSFVSTTHVRTDIAVPLPVGQ